MRTGFKFFQSALPATTCGCPKEDPEHVKFVLVHAVILAPSVNNSISSAFSSDIIIDGSRGRVSAVGYVGSSIPQKRPELDRIGVQLTRSGKCGRHTMIAHIRQAYQLDPIANLWKLGCALQLPTIDSPPSIAPPRGRAPSETG